MCFATGSNLSQVEKIDYVQPTFAYVQSSMNALNQLLSILKVEANVFHNGQYCGTWAVDLSGQKKMLFHVVTRGTCFVETAGASYQLETGDAVFFPSDMKHLISSEKENDVEPNVGISIPMTEILERPSTGLVCGNFGHSHPVFQRLLQQLPNMMIVRRVDDSASGRILKMMLDESHSSDQNASVLLSRLADCLFFLLVRDHLNSDVGVFAAFAHPKLSAVMERIHAETNSKLTLDDLANVGAMSRSSFANLFKEIVGQSPVDYITHWRMSLAYQYLRDEGLSTLDVALKVGYESESSFAKAFTRVMGFGPGQARSHASV